MAFKLSDIDFKIKYGFPKPKPEDREVVLTCSSGRRAALAWQDLQPLGYCNIR